MNGLTPQLFRRSHADSCGYRLVIVLADLSCDCLLIGREQSIPIRETKWYLSGHFVTFCEHAHINLDCGTL
jgi:hypothetical protein